MGEMVRHPNRLARIAELFSHPEQILPSIFQASVLTPGRVRLAYAIAVTTDLVQFLLGPLGWVGADEILDVAAMMLTSRTIGFHPLLLPTFALEFLPVVDMLPTWTGCVALVVALRKGQQSATLPPPSSGPIIDV
jgi:hypothetical protein